MIPLSELQKYQIITILRDIASFDHNIDLLEAVRIRLIGLKMDLHAAKIDEALADDLESLDSVKKRIAEHFPNENQKKFLYQQCVLLMMSNREIAPEEQKAIEEIRISLSLDIGFHSRIMDWCNEGLAWEKRGEDLVGRAIAE